MTVGEQLNESQADGPNDQQDYFGENKEGQWPQIPLMRTLIGDSDKLDLRKSQVLTQQLLE